MFNLLFVLITLLFFSFGLLLLTAKDFKDPTFWKFYFQPIYEKANNAIQEVAKENKFTYVFDLAARSIIYFSEDSENVLPLVKKKLGIE